MESRRFSFCASSAQSPDLATFGIRHAKGLSGRRAGTGAEALAIFAAMVAAERFAERKPEAGGIPTRGDEVEDAKRCSPTNLPCPKRAADKFMLYAHTANSSTSRTACLRYHMFLISTENIMTTEHSSNDIHSGISIRRCSLQIWISDLFRNLIQAMPRTQKYQTICRIYHVHVLAARTPFRTRTTCQIIPNDLTSRLTTIRVYKD